MAEPTAADIEELKKLVAEVLARQNELEKRIAQLEGAPISSALPVEPLVTPTPPSIAVEPIHTAVPEPEAVAATQEPKLESKLGLTLINRIGVITLVLGVGFFFKWAVDNNWVGPTGRVVLGLLAGCASLFVADVLWRKSQQVFAQGITGAGVAIVYLSFYAAFDFYHLIPQVVAFLLLLATTVGAATLALRYNAIAIAALGSCGAYLIPLLLSNGTDHPWFLICYLLLIDIAATELGRRRSWAIVEVLSLVATTLIFGSWLVSTGRGPDDRAPAILGALALCLQRSRTSLPVLFLLAQAFTTFAVTSNGEMDSPLSLSLLLLVAAGGLAFVHWRHFRPVVASAFASLWLVLFLLEITEGPALLTGSGGFLLFAAWMWWRLIRLDEAASGIEWAVFAFNGAVYFAFAYSRLHLSYHEWLGLLAVAVGGVYCAFGLLLQQRTKPGSADLSKLAFGIAAAFLALAIPIQLVGFSITIAWSIQGAALAWIALRWKSVAALVGALWVFALALAHLIAADSRMYQDPYVYTPVFNLRLLVFVVLAAALLLSAYWGSAVNAKVALAAFVGGHLVMLAGLCLEVIGWAERSPEKGNVLSRETVGITLLFAVYAVLLVGVGVARRSAVLRMAGLVLTAVVILKLYMFDVWQLGRVYQIVAFVILGILLLSTSFLYSRFKGWIENWNRED